MPTYVIALLTAFVVAIIVTPLVRSTAIRFGVVDQPDPRRKLHKCIVARAGGVGVLVATLTGCALASIWLVSSHWEMKAVLPYAGIASSMVLICLLGLVDDVWGMRGRQKLLGQILIAAVVVFSGVTMHNISVFGLDVPLGILAAPMTILFLLATTNALNLIDGSDGLCSTVGVIITGSLGIMAGMGGNESEAVIAFALCGALIGFLVFNFPPASIFLGDSGSLLIGMICGTLAVRCALKGPTAGAIIAPMAILIVPLFDSAMAIVRRKLTGRSIYTTDRAHLHHTIKERGFSDFGLLLVAGSLCAFASMSALGGAFLKNDFLAALGAVGVLAVLVGSRVFGFAELMLVARRIKHFTHSMLQPVASAGESIQHQSVRLQGSRNWETIWATMTEFAERQELSKISLDLNAPWLHEGFHANWQRSRLPDRAERWSTSIPIHAEGRIAGRLDLIGPIPAGRTFEVLALLANVLEDLQPQIETMLSQPAAAFAGPLTVDSPETSSSEPSSSEQSNESLILANGVTSMNVSAPSKMVI